MTNLSKIRTALLATTFALGAGVAAAANAPAMPEITDRRLGSMTYGIESAVHWVEKLETGDIRGAERILNDLQKLGQRLARVRNADPAQVKMLDGYLAQLAMVVIKTGNSSVPEPRANEETLAHGMTAADAMTFMNEMNGKYMIDGGAFYFYRPFSSLYHDDKTLTEEDVETIVAFIQRFEAERAKDQPLIAAIYEATNKGYSLHDFMAKGAHEKMADDLKLLARFLKSDIERGIQDAERRTGLDPERHGSQLRGDQAKTAIALHDRTLVSMNAAAKLKQAVSLDLPDFIDGREDFIANAEKFADMVVLMESGQLAKLPKDIGDSDLRSVAENVLGKKKYDIEGWEKLIVNAQAVPRDRVDTRIFNGRLETTVREWQEFQVTTVEKDADGKLYLHYNVIAKFSRGSSTTPIGEWILSKRFKGAAIAAEKI